MSFVKNIFSKMSGGASLDGADEPEDDEDLTETSSDESDDTGVFSPDSFSPANSNSDMERGLNGVTILSDANIPPPIREDEETLMQSINLNGVDADCSTISNFFGYWYVVFFLTIV